MQVLRFVSVFLLLLASSCGKNSKNEVPKQQALHLNIHSEPPSLDPRKANDTTSSIVIKMCFDGLTRIDPQGEPALSLAERVDVSEDQKLYVFHLREAHWSDGTLVLASDFEQTWKTILSPAFPSEFAIDLFVLKNGKAAKDGKCSVDAVGVKALDERTLQVELDHPTPCFFSMLATHAFYAVPSHIAEKYPNWAENAGAHYVSNGPFCMKEWRHGNRILVEKNPHYWDRDAVQLEHIQLSMIEDENTELSLFENGQLDWAGHPLSSLSTDALPSLKKKGILQTYPMAGVYYYIFNTQAFPFNNTKLRRAFTLAIDRTAIVQNITQAEQTPALSYVPPIMWSEEKQYFQDANIAEARRLFAEALDELKLDRADLPAFKLSYNTVTAHHKIAQAIQEQWNKAFGVKVHLENKEWKVFLDEVREYKFQIARMGGVATIRDPLTFLDNYRYLSSRGNSSQWTHPRFTELLEEADLTTDAQRRTALLRDAEAILIEEMPILPIYFYTGSYVKNPSLKGVCHSELSDIDFKWAYLDASLSR